MFAFNNVTTLYRYACCRAVWKHCTNTSKMLASINQDAKRKIVPVIIGSPTFWKSKFSVLDMKGAQNNFPWNHAQKFFFSIDILKKSNISKEKKSEIRKSENLKSENLKIWNRKSGIRKSKTRKSESSKIWKYDIENLVKIITN